MIKRTLGATITFVSNDIENFCHHRSHLVDVSVELGMDVIVLAGGNGKPPANCEFQKVDIERFKFHWNDFNLFKKILTNISKNKPKVVHFINLKPYLYGGVAARLAKSMGWRGKIVVSVPGLGRLYDTQNIKLGKSLRLRAVERVLKFCLRDAVICFETEADRDFWIKRGLTHIENTVVTNGTGIDLAQFTPPLEREPNKPMKVLYAGRLLKAKGLDVFLRAAEMSHMDNVEMVVAGQTEADPDAVSEDVLLNHSSVFYVGKVDDMPRLLGETDVVILPSRYNEGVPRILIEAAACACVPVATDFAGSRALIKEGNTGYFLQQTSAEKQATEIMMIINKLSENYAIRDTVGRNAREHVSKSGFSSHAVKAAFESIYSR